jgi:ADP-heptose:LPS heptosyltransferase
MANPTEHSNSSPAKTLRRRLVRWIGRLRPAASASGMSAKRLPTTGIHRILICRATKTLGETLLLAPLLRELETTYPGAEVDLVTRCGAATQLFAAYPRLRRVVVLPPRMLGAPLRLWRILRRLRADAYDLAIDPYLWSHSDRSLVVHARARFSLGFDSARKNGRLSHAVTAPDSVQHAAKLPVYLLRHALGTATAENAAAQEYPLLDLRLREAERAVGAQTLAALLHAAGASRPAIGVYAHATGVKRFERVWWDDFLALIQLRYPRHAIVEILPMDGKSQLADRYPAFYSSDPRALAAFASQLALIVSGDCGVMHLVSASGAPTAGIFVASDISGWNVYGPGRITVDARRRGAADVADEVARQAAALLGA